MLKNYILPILLFIYSIQLSFGQCNVSISPSSPQSICNGSSITLTASGIGINTYTWTPTTSLNFTNIATPVATPTVTTTYTVVADCGGGNTGTATITVTVNTLPNVPTITITNNNNCAGSTVGFSTNNQSGCSYSWSFGDGSPTANGLNVTHVYSPTFGNVTQNYTVSVTSTNTFGCTRLFTQTVSVKQKPDASIADFTSVTPFTNCGGVGGTFDLFIDNTSTTIATNSNYQIDWGDGSASYSNASLPNTGTDHIYVTQGYFTITLTVTGQNGCVSTKTYTVYNGSNPSVSFPNPGTTTSHCVPYTLTIPINGTSGNPPGTIYIITTNDGMPPVTYSHPPPANFTHTFTTNSCNASANGSGVPNSFYINCSAQNPCGISPQPVWPITTSSEPISNFSISPDTVACVNSTVTFTNTSIDGVTVDAFGVCDNTTRNNWRILPGTGWTLVNGSLGNNNPSNNPSQWGTSSIGVSFTTPGTYSILMIERNSCGRDTMIRTICVVPIPVPDFTLNPNNGCAPLNVVVTNNSNTLNECVPATYLWTVTYAASPPCAVSSSFSFTGGTSSSSINPHFIFNNPGIYTVTLSITNHCGTYATSHTVNVKGPPIVTVTPIPNSCGAVSVSPTATVINCGINAPTYSWGNPFNSTSATPPPFSYNGNGNHNINLAVTNECGTTNATTSFTIYPFPNVNAGNNVTICNGLSTTLSGSANGGTSPYTYSWSSNPVGFVSTLQNPVVSPNITTTYSLNVTDVHSCSSTDLVVVTVNPLPLITVNSPTICIGQNATLTANGANSYSWNTGGLTSAITVSPTTTTSYTVTGTTTLTGCANTAISIVTINPLPVVNAGPSITLCNQSIPYTLTGYSPAGGTWSGTGVTTGGIFTPTAGNFILTYTNTNAITTCTNSDTMVVTVVAPQIANAGTGFVRCINAPIVNLTGYSPAGGTWTGAGIAGSTFNPAIAGVGTHIITYSFGAGTCLSTDTIIVLVNSLPIVTSSSTTICAGQNATLTANGANSYLWNTGGLTSAITVSPTTTTSYTVTGTTTLTGCANSVISIVTVNPLPIVDAGPSITLCNQPIPYTLTGYSPAGGTWSGTGVTAGGIFTPTAGNFILTYTYTSAITTCTNSDTMVVTVVAPQIANAGTGFIRCISAPVVNLVGYTPVGGTWTGAGIVGSTFDPATAGAGTHIITYSFGAGTCLSTDTIIVLVNSLPIVTSSSTTICAGQSATITANGANSYLWNTGGLTSAITVSPITTTSYTVTGTATPTGCSNTATSTVTVNPLPIVDAGIGQTYCNQSSLVTLAGYSPIGGTWAGGGILNGILGTFNPALPALGNNILSYTFTNGNGCTNTDTIINFIVIPAFANAGLDDTVCLNNGLLTLTGFSPLTALWNGPGIINPSGIFDPTITGLGTFNLTLNYGAGTCFTSDTKTITILSLPQISAGTNETVCTSDPIFNLTGYSPLGGTWSGTGITNGVLGTFNPLMAGAGVYTLTYSYTNPITGCTNNSTKTITVGALPTVLFSNTAFGCVNTPISFTNSTSGGSTYSWEFGDGASSTVFSSSNTYATIGNYTIQLIAYTPLGCSDSTTSTIQIIDVPVSLFTTTPVVGCAPLAVSFTNNSSGVNVLYLWDFGNGITSTNIAAPNQIYQQGLHDTTYIITLNSSNQCGSNIFVDSVLVHPLPLVSFGTNVISGCSPLNISIINDTSGNVSQYIWNFGDGSPIFTTTISNTLTHTFTTGTSDTTYLITLIGVNACGSDTMTQAILVHPNTVTAFFNTSSISGCSPFTVSFTDLSQGATFISWDFGDGNGTTTSSPIHTYQNPGTYLCVQSINNGCSFGADSVIITIYAPPSLSFTPSVSVVCANQPVNFANTSTNCVNYNWDFGDMTTSNLNSPTHVYTSGGIYTITLVGISTSYGCIDSVSQVFIIDTTPVPQISSSLLYGCAPLTINFNNTSIYSNFYSWNFGDGNTSALEFPSNLYNLPGTYTVTFIAENIFQCKDTTQLHILVNPRPIASFTISPFECTYPATVDFINNSSGAISYSWNFGDGNGFSSTVQNPSMTYENPNQYPITLISSNIFGCLDTTFNTVIVCPLFTFYLPSAFSPNGDLMNDEFFGEGLGIKDFQMDIFDRWGNLVFHTDEIKNHWDGTYKGRMVQEDVYVYKINLTDIFFSPHKYIGKITVVR